jgi:hypothetical protein
MGFRCFWLGGLRQTRRDEVADQSNDRSQKQCKGDTAFHGAIFSVVLSLPEGPSPRSYSCGSKSQSVGAAGAAPVLPKNPSERLRFRLSDTTGWSVVGQTLSQFLSSWKVPGWRNQCQAACDRNLSGIGFPFQVCWRRLRAQEYRACHRETWRIYLVKLGMPETIPKVLTPSVL